MDQPGTTGLVENPNLSETALEIQLITLMYSELIKEGRRKCLIFID